VADESIRVQGLADLRRELKALNLTEDLKDANNRVAQLVADEAEKKARALGRMEAKAAESLKANRAQSKATVSIGGARYPFALGAEFGSFRFKQFRSWTGSNEGSGYWLWPAIRETRERVIEMYGDEIEKLTAKAFPD